MPPRKGLLVDFGGVLTTDVFASFQAFCDAEGLLPETVRDRFMKDPLARELLADLEAGGLTEEEFEPKFAAVLEVEPAGLIDRLFGGMKPDEAMLDAVRAAKRRRQDRPDLELVGPRALRPQPVPGALRRRRHLRRGRDPQARPAKIYALGAEAVGLEPAECVFVDDLPGNLKPARELGMATVHHVRAEDTIPELEELLGVSFAVDENQH